MALASAQEILGPHIQVRAPIGSPCITYSKLIFMAMETPSCNNVFHEQHLQQLFHFFIQHYKEQYSPVILQLHESNTSLQIDLCRRRAERRRLQPCKLQNIVKQQWQKQKAYNPSQFR